MPPSARMRTSPFSSVGHFRREHRNDVHLFVVGDEPFDDARLDVLENVRRVAVHRVGLAIVADDQEIVRRARPSAGLGACRNREGERRAARVSRDVLRHQPRDERNRDRAMTKQLVVERCSENAAP